jgi:hypothetical protein
MRRLGTAATKPHCSGDLIRINPAAPVPHCTEGYRAGGRPFASRRRLRVRLFGHVAQAFDLIVRAFHRSELARDNIA